MNLMPFFEVKFLNQFGPDEFDVFADSDWIREQLKKGASSWDLTLNIDYNKLRKFI